MFKGDKMYNRSYKKIFTLIENACYNGMDITEDGDDELLARYSYCSNHIHFYKTVEDNVRVVYCFITDRDTNKIVFRATTEDKRFFNFLCNSNCRRLRDLTLAVITTIDEKTTI